MPEENKPCPQCGTMRTRIGEEVIEQLELMRQRILAGRVIHTDDTTVPVQDAGKTRTGRLWVYCGDVDHTYSVFDSSPNRTKEHPKRWLGDIR